MEPPQEDPRKRKLEHDPGMAKPPTAVVVLVVLGVSVGALIDWV
jgi:hypothetical protein